MTRRKIITLAIMAVTVLAWIGWDVYVAITGAPDAGDTFSRTLRNLAARYPGGVFAIGFVFGHCFWGQPVPLVNNKPVLPRI